jgi:hypothetical protein
MPCNNRTCTIADTDVACDNLRLWGDYVDDIMTALDANGYEGWCKKEYLPDYTFTEQLYFRQQLVATGCDTGLLKLACRKNGTGVLSSISDDAKHMSNIVNAVRSPVLCSTLRCVPLTGCIIGDTRWLCCIECADRKSRERDG